MPDIATFGDFDMAKFFITVRSVVDGAFVNNTDSQALGAVRYLAVPDGEAAAPSHAIGLRPWLAQLMATFPRIDKANPPDNLLFFVHGFNLGMPDVDQSHQEVTRGLDGKLSCTVVSFDWPSWTNTFAYLEELDVAKKTAIILVNAAIKPFLNAQTQDCRVAVHALAHSMGAFVLREALDHADDGIKTGSDSMLNQLVMIAADVEAADFVDGNKDTESMLGHSYRLTNYFNKFDEVLQISNVKRAGVEPRAGRGGLPPDAPAKTVNIDCSDVYQALPPIDDPIESAKRSHSWYLTSDRFYEDLAATLFGAVDRTVVAGRTSGPDGKKLVLSA